MATTGRRPQADRDERSSRADARTRWTSDVVLADGGRIRIRPAAGADVDAIAELLRGLSDESRYRRFLSAGSCDGVIGFLDDLGSDHHDALVAESDDVVVGVVECIRDGSGDRAEVAFAVDDDHQHRGVGTALLEHMTARARTRGIGTLVAATLGENAPMLAVFREAGYEQRRTMQAGVIDVVLDIGSPAAPSDSPIGLVPSRSRLSTASVVGAVRALAVVCGGPVVLTIGVLVSAAVATASAVAGHFPPVASLLVLTVALAYVTVGVRWTRRWGAERAEIGAHLPGDEFVPRPGLRMTRAVTIDATPDTVWAWLAQIGADRAGFYSYAWLENLAGCRLRNADAIQPEWRHQQVGEPVMLHPLNGIPITRLEPPWSFAMGGWFFALEARPGGRTRLLARTRVPRGVASWAYALFLELPHFVMERRMLLGLRKRAEASPARDAAGA